MPEGEPTYVPFGVPDDELETHFALVDGVPAWLRQTILHWMASRVKYERNSNWAHSATILAISRNTRVHLDVEDIGGSLTSLGRFLSQLNALSDLELLKVLDYLLSELKGHQLPIPAQPVDQALREASSKWCVGKRGADWGLVPREPEAVRQAIGEVIAAETTATRLLSRAWSKVQALVPDAPGAYSDAVRAAEVAAIPVVLMNKSDGTLGDVAGTVASSERWKGPLREHRKAPSHETLAAMMRTLYSGHRDRHGKPDYSDCSYEEARAAILLATVIVAWFESGGVKLHDTVEST